MLSPDSPSHEHDLPVLDVLKRKHPEPLKIKPSTFMVCDSLPPLADLDITGGHVEFVACQIQ